MANLTRSVIVNEKLVTEMGWLSEDPIGKRLFVDSAYHTVIGVVATNAKLTKEETNKVAQMAHNGLARVIRPAHTMFDGDTIFALATGKKRADVNLIGGYAAEVTAQAIISATLHAESIAGVPAAAHR